VESSNGRVRGERVPTLLVVDDDSGFAAEIAAVLSNRCRVVSENGSRRALQCLRETHVALAIVDVDLPPFLGPHSCDEGLILTRLLTDHHMIPAVVITNSNDQTVLRDAIRAGAVAVEPKQTFVPERIEEVVSRYARIRPLGSAGSDG
jgi:CheY-like chemotaxis protein